MEKYEYKEYRKSTDIHGVALYPAVMVAPMQRDVLEKIIPLKSKMKIVDPFHGSGTALYESAEVSNSCILYGCDINPFANLITKSKLMGLDDSIKQDINNMTIDILYRDFTMHHFNNIEKWFRDDIINDLSRIKSAISRVTSYKNRLYLWCVFSNIIRKYSNTRTDTYKLYSKSDDKILLTKNNVIDEFLKKAVDSIELYKDITNEFHLVKSDVNNYLKSIEDNYFDICITSPPYGDNPTTVPYGQFSSLPLMWIDPEDLDLEGWELNNYSIIDNRSLGGNKNNIYSLNEYHINLINDTLQGISAKKQTKVLSFFADYFKTLDQIVRVTDKYIVMTLGNRTVDRVNIDLTTITKMYLEMKGFINTDTISRKIIRKRMPSRTSRVNNNSVNSINKEFLIIHQKTQE